MSAGAVFRLIANDGKADRLLMATALLRQRLADAGGAGSASSGSARSASSGSAHSASSGVSLAYIEQTHLLYVHAHFMPYAAVGCEYNKVRPQSASVTLGGGVTFSIPQFGDFIGDMVCRVRLGACSTQAASVYERTATVVSANTLARDRAKAFEDEIVSRGVIGAGNISYLVTSLAAIIFWGGTPMREIAMGIWNMARSLPATPESIVNSVNLGSPYPAYTHTITSTHSALSPPVSPSTFTNAMSAAATGILEFIMNERLISFIAPVAVVYDPPSAIEGYTIIVAGGNDLTINFVYACLQIAARTIVGPAYPGTGVVYPLILEAISQIAGVLGHTYCVIVVERIATLLGITLQTLNPQAVFEQAYQYVSRLIGSDALAEAIWIAMHASRMIYTDDGNIN